MPHTDPPILSVYPSRALVDEVFKVLVENLPPGCPVTVHSLHLSEDDNYWEAYGHYISDHRGSVCISEDVSFGGTYTGIEPMGLLWSLCPVPGSRDGLRLRKMNVCTPMLVNISVHRGHLKESFRDQPPLASALIERWYMAPGVKKVDMGERGMSGTLFIPPGPGPFPGLLDLWGGGGGLVENRAALLASHGYVSLALEYLTSGGTTQLDYNYIEKAFNIIQDHPVVMPDRVGILGLSLGSFVTFNLAAKSTIINPHCCVCISGFHCHPYRNMDEMIEINRNLKKIHVDENNNEIWRDMSLPIPNDPSKKIDMGKIKCPLLLVCGHDDQSYPAVEMAEDIAQMVHTAGKDHLLTKLFYHGAGHLIEPPYSPHIRASTFMAKTKHKVILLWGGQTKPHSDAQEDSWKKILAFLQHHLYSTPNPRAKM